LEREYIRRRRRFRTRVQEIQKYIGAGTHPEQKKIQASVQEIQKYIGTGAHPEQEKIQSKSTKNTKVHWSRRTSGAGEDSEREYKKHRSTLEQEHMRG
jgi:hypothetical protein